ncbi:unnamed protein product [Rhizophagus irregularis]|uniref:Uncharacterized protein n=1 Tax=Rhizophagus irregularis TaxID=588596 RepID=A0A2I1HJT2_9GLOM|nr:hypothetical protein RhiirA4_481601 [Rhizophagus irregularis]CAB4436839.1 unnamed protein product [Rhizophagus irregularis]CAB4436933.1 unnamed protein product [Rhizophagus irregularis]
MKIKRPYYCKEKQCEICEDWYKCGSSNRHFRKPCKGNRKIEIRTEKCGNCNRKISKSNFKRHRKVCEKFNTKEKDTQILHLYTPGTIYEYIKIMEIKRKQIKEWLDDAKFESNISTQICDPEDW